LQHALVAACEYGNREVVSFLEVFEIFLQQGVMDCNVDRWATADDEQSVRKRERELAATSTSLALSVSLGMSFAHNVLFRRTDDVSGALVDKN